jgi:hypothetical protein
MNVRAWDEYMKENLKISSTFLRTDSFPEMIVSNKLDGIRNNIFD